MSYSNVGVFFTKYHIGCIEFDRKLFLILDVLIWLELINVNVTLDVRATPRQVALVLRPRLTDANLNSVDLMPSAYPKTELEDASASLDTLMETLRPVVHLDLEVGILILIFIVCFIRKL